MTTLMKPLVAATALLVLAPAMALAHGDEGEKPTVGHPGEVSQIDRTIEVSMGEMYFDPDTLEFERGETVKFVIINEGSVVHEFNLGNDAMHDAHASEMTTLMEKGLIGNGRIHRAKMRAAGMMHADANAVLVEPGETAEVIWTFSGTGDMELACNIPGHREAGMVADIEVHDAGDGHDAEPVS